MHETIFVKRPKFLTAISSLLVEQILVHLSRFLHFSQKVVVRMTLRTVIEKAKVLRQEFYCKIQVVYSSLKMSVNRLG